MSSHDKKKASPEPAENSIELETDELTRADSATRIMGFKLPWFFLLLGLVIATAMLDAMPNEMLPGFAVLILFGALFNWIGERVPVLRNFGLPTVLCVLVPAILLSLGLFPVQLADVMSNFTEDINFLDFYVASLIAGSILGMPRTLLIKAGLRYAVPLLGTVITVFASIGLIGALTGFGLSDAIFYVAGPVLGGGIGAGVVPMSQMYADQLGGSAGSYLAQLVPAVVVANVLAIFLAGVFNGVTYKGQQFFLGFNGQGRIVRVEGKAKDFQAKPRPETGAFQVLAIGLSLAAGIYLAGNLIAAFIPGVHAYAWAILLAGILKVSNILPQSFQDAVSTWYGFVAGTLTSALLVGVSVTFIELEELGTLLGNPVYLALVAGAVLIATLVSGLIGWLVKMYFVETSVSVGLGMTDMGGTGDVAVVSAANRLELMPFLQVSSRLGGAFVLLLLSVLLPIIG